MKFDTTTTGIAFVLLLVVLIGGRLWAQWEPVRWWWWVSASLCLECLRSSSGSNTVSTEQTVL